jgi:peptidoglycan/xylan/chitin deacetylase (PgdA/CDA1 family)
MSLDFELYWGVRDQQSIARYGDNIRGVHTALPKILALLAAYGARATFACVGLLFCSDRQSVEAERPHLEPSYVDPSLSPYGEYLIALGSDQEQLHFGGKLIDLVATVAAQEIGSHTFSHYYCLAPGQTVAQFEADLTAATRMAAKRGLRLRSFVFPRNQFNNDYLQAIANHGFVCYRGNERSWLNQASTRAQDGPLQRAVRLLDSYVNLSGENCYRFDARLHSAHGLVDIPASRFLRPYIPRLKWLEPLRLRRIKSSMTYAARQGQLYHLWWHPHNFGVDQDENLAFLRRILDHYRALNRRWGLRSQTMGELAQDLTPT